MIFTLAGTFQGGDMCHRGTAQQSSYSWSAILQQRERWFPRGAASSDLHQSRRDGLAPYNVCCRIVRPRALQCGANPADPAVTLYQQQHVYMGPAKMCIWDASSVG